LIGIDFKKRPLKLNPDYALDFVMKTQNAIKIGVSAYF